MDAQAVGFSVDSALADPRVLAGPVPQRERISSLDVLRGFALLGILVMNISDYALPGNFDFNPTILGPLSKLNLFLWMGRLVLFEGKMRALFSMLFGAGVILLTTRLEKRGEEAIAGDIFTRRNMWLTLFGVLHAYFLWWGDILYFYGMTALLFLYPCRKLKARTLLIAGLVVVLAGMGYRMGRLQSRTQLAQRAEAAKSAEAAQQTLTDQQKEDIQAWKRVLEKTHPSREELDKETAELRGGYVSVFRHNAEQVIDEQGAGYYRFGFFDSLAMMLLGMGLLKLGFLSGQLANRVYAWIALTGYAIGLPLGALCTWKVWENGFNPLAILRWEFLPYDILRILVGLAHASVVLLIVKAGWLKWITRPLAAVGQTALSNYLGTTVICTAVFYGWGFAMFGRLPFYKLFYVVATIWMVNLAASTIWLKYFRFGPLEWAWRSLTYWRAQPMRRTQQAMPAVAAPTEG